MPLPSCYLNAKRGFERNIDKIVGKRKYLKIILQYYDCDRGNSIPYLSVCKKTKEWENLSNHISEEIKKEHPSIKNYIRYPIFMALLWTEIRIGENWHTLLYEDVDGIKSNIKTDHSYFDGPPYKETVKNVRWIN